MKNSLNGLTIVLAAAVGISLLVLSPGFAADYTITEIIDLGTFGGTKSEAWGINNLNEVVGMAYLPGDLVYHAFLYSGGIMTDLGTANCTDPYGKSVARRINDSGQIVGTSCFWVPGNVTRAFIYSGGVMTDLGTLGGAASDGLGINNLGHVVGSAAIPGDTWREAFLHEDGVMTDLGTLNGACCSQAWGINDDGQIVGESRYSAPAATHAFLYSEGVMTDITPGLGCCGKANDINSSGQVVGTTPFPGTDNHAFLYSGGVLTDIGSLGGPVGSEAWAINNFGQIVGFAYIPPGCYGNCVPHAFLYENGVMTDLNSMLPPNSEWELNYALDVNDNGRIVGIGTINDQRHAFLATISLLPPETVSPPSILEGPTGGFTSTSYFYSAEGASSSRGHSIQYLFNWGDGTDSGWLPVGQTSATKSWLSVGSFLVRAKARCSNHTDVESDWSAELAVNIIEDETRFTVCSLYSLPTFSWDVVEPLQKSEIEFSMDTTFNSPIKVRVSGTQAIMKSSIWKKVVLLPGLSGGSIYWRVVGKRSDNTTYASEARSITIEPPQAAGSPTISTTSRGLTPELSWENNCNTKFTVWFGKGNQFTKKKALSFNIKAPNDNEGKFTKGLTSGQWRAIRRVVEDVSGSTIYWYIESWDGVKRHSQTDTMNFVLTD